jgi:YHS domain-containing protein
LRLIIYIVIAYIIYSVLKKFLLASGTAKRRGQVTVDNDADVPKASETVLDPVCDSYIPKDRAIKITHGGNPYYFCGEECRDKFISDKDGGS